jgi:hypothetical protein
MRPETINQKTVLQGEWCAVPATTDKNNKPVVNAMTVDVEDYFQVSAFEGVIDRGDWDRLPARVEHNTHRILDLFADHGVQATFFTLGWVAERYPQLVRRIVESGHELASRAARGCGGLRGARLPGGQLLHRHRYPLGA